MTEKKLSDIQVKKLYSSIPGDIFQALTEIQHNGNSRYIPMLVDVLHSTKEAEIRKQIIKILSEVKHSDAVPEIIQAIENEKYADIQEILIRICWENGLDYTNYFSTLIDILINGDYMTAFEAHTVIESTEGNLSETSALEYINTLKSALINASDERKILIHSIIQFLPSIIKA